MTWEPVEHPLDKPDFPQRQVDVLEQVAVNTHVTNEDYIKFFRIYQKFPGKAPLGGRVTERPIQEVI